MDTAEAIGAEMPKGGRGGGEIKKNISRIASSNADKLSQQMLTSREREKKAREKKDVRRVAALLRIWWPVSTV